MKSEKVISTLCSVLCFGLYNLGHILQFPHFLFSVLSSGTEPCATPFFADRHLRDLGPQTLLRTPHNTALSL